MVLAPTKPRKSVAPKSKGFNPYPAFLEEREWVWEFYVKQRLSYTKEAQNIEKSRFDKFVKLCFANKQQLARKFGLSPELRHPVWIPDNSPIERDPDFVNLKMLLEARCATHPGRHLIASLTPEAVLQNSFTDYWGRTAKFRKAIQKYLLPDDIPAIDRLFEGAAAYRAERAVWISLNPFDQLMASNNTGYSSCLAVGGNRDHALLAHARSQTSGIALDIRDYEDADRKSNPFSGKKKICRAWLYFPDENSFIFGRNYSFTPGQIASIVEQLKLWTPGALVRTDSGRVEGNGIYMDSYGSEYWAEQNRKVLWTSGPAVCLSCGKDTVRGSQQVCGGECRPLKCDGCARFFGPVAAVRAYGAERYHERCYNAVIARCPRCGDPYRRMYGATDPIYGGDLCSYCYISLWDTCDECGDITRTGDLIGVLGLRRYGFPACTYRVCKPKCYDKLFCHRCNTGHYFGCPHELIPLSKLSKAERAERVEEEAKRAEVTRAALRKAKEMLEAYLDGQKVETVLCMVENPPGVEELS